jgi:hypothetical protein
MAATFTTRDDTIGMSTITATAETAHGDTEPVAWICHFTGDPYWTLYYRGECLGDVDKEIGVRWIVDAARRAEEGN